MDSYIILIILVDLAVMIGMTVHGWRKGFARLLTEAISLIVSVAVITMISSVMGLWDSGDTSGAVFGVVMLIGLGICYKLVKLILGSIRILSNLPVIHGLNKLLGLIVGFVEGFAILYFLEYILRAYLLV